MKYKGDLLAIAFFLLAQFHVQALISTAYGQPYPDPGYSQNPGDTMLRSESGLIKVWESRYDGSIGLGTPNTYYYNDVAVLCAIDELNNVIVKGTTRQINSSTDPSDIYVQLNAGGAVTTTRGIVLGERGQKMITDRIYKTKKMDLYPYQGSQILTSKSDPGGWRLSTRSPGIG